MESLLEIQRRCHEERERLQKIMTEEFMDKKLSEKYKIFSENRIKIYLNVSHKIIHNKRVISRIYINYSNMWIHRHDWLICMKIRKAKEKLKFQHCLVQTNLQNFIRA